MKIKIANRRYNAHTHTVGACYATVATVRIAGRLIRSRFFPVGSERAALENLMGAVLAAHPTATVIDD
jgi:hypothetical protein